MRTYGEIAADATEGPAFSNSTQFEIWAADRGCYTCRNDDMGIGGDEKVCPIFSVSLIERTIPREWTTTTAEDRIYGDYTCTEYEERRDDDGDDPEPEPEPPPVIEGQIDMFEVFADRIVEQLPEPALTRGSAS